MLEPSRQNLELELKYSAMVVHHSRTYGNVVGDNLVLRDHTSINQEYS